MNTTGIFKTHYATIPFKKFGEPIYLIPFGDVHRSSPMCHEEKWKEFLDWAKSKPRAYFLGLGDYDDLASTTERSILLDRKLHESTKITLEDQYKRFTLRLAKELEFMRGRLIGLIEGNHYGEFQNGTTTTQLLADKLGTAYLGVSCFVRLFLILKNEDVLSHRGLTVDIWAHHGKGAARLVGGSLNRVSQMEESAEADIYLMGHDHKKSAATKTRLKLVGNGPDVMRLSHRKVLICRTGSFLKGYEEGKASYIVDGAMNPTDLGVVKIEITPRRERKGSTDQIEVDLHASI